MRALAAGLALALAALLGGCGNLVQSDAALFAKADTRGAPVFRRGLWIGDDPDCKVDERLPREAWPGCAAAWVMTSRGLASAFDEDKEMHLLLAAGDPAIIQIEPPEREEGPFGYWALAVTAADRRGRATAFSAWPVLCGPPDGADAPVSAAQAREGAQPYASVTRHPLPGLEVRGANCFAARAATVRDAARASRAWTPFPMDAHWVRDGER